MSPVPFDGNGLHHSLIVSYRSTWFYWSWIFLLLASVEVLSFDILQRGMKSFLCWHFAQHAWLYMFQSCSPFLFNLKSSKCFGLPLKKNCFDALNILVFLSISTIKFLERWPKLCKILYSMLASSVDRQALLCWQFYFQFLCQWDYCAFFYSYYIWADTYIQSFTRYLKSFF